jgi:hypothetical protein
MAWGDFNHRLAVAFTCNRLLETEANRQRWVSLNNAVWDMLGVKQNKPHKDLFCRGTGFLWENARLISPLQF